MSVTSFLILLPINFTGGGRANASDIKGYVNSLLYTDFLRFTMANVTAGSPRLWVHCAAAYLQTMVVVRELLIEYNAYSTIRHRYLLSKEPHLRTVLVSNIPRHLRSPRKIGTYFRHVYPQAVKSVTICQNLLALENIVAKRTKVLSQIEQELLALCRSEKRKLLGHDRIRRRCAKAFKACMRQPCERCCGVEVGSAQERLSNLYVRLEEMNKDIEREQIRRQRVMRYMDRMSSGEGTEDIDYALASAFNGREAPAWKKALKDRDSSSYRPPAIGAPRNADGTVRENSQVVGSQSSSARRRNGGGVGSGPESEIPHLNDSAIQGQGADGDYSESFPSTTEDGSLSTRKSKKPVGKAKRAITRYSTSIRDGSVFGRSLNDFTPFANGGTGLGTIEDHTNEVTDKAFVVMRTFTASTIAIQSMHSSKPGSMEVSTAPEPRDILWENVYYSKGARRTRRYLAEILSLFIIAFYAVPVALVSLLVSESALVSISPRLQQLDKASALFSAAIATVQPMCLVSIQMLLPPTFVAICRFEGMISFSEAQMKAFSRYFTFQVLNIFLVTSIAGTIFDTLALIIENPESAFEMLGNSLPRMSSFFITFVTMKGFVGLGVEVARIVPIIQSFILLFLFPGSTLRAQRSVRLGMRGIDDPGFFAFHKVLAQDMLVVVIGVVFAVVAPIVLIPCAVFCFMSRICWTHHHLYVYESVFETGGLFWPKIFRRFVFGLIIAQATITGQFILKDARHEAYATIALMILTYIFLRSTRARYDSTSSVLPLEVATVMDISLGHEEELQREQSRAQNQYAKKSFPPGEVNTNGGAGAEASDQHCEDDNYLGSVIGNCDPFELAYVQPVIRASPNARPEQPFPPAQIGREEVLLGHNMSGSTAGVISDDNMGPYDDSATVRLKSYNQHDRRAINRWWKEQMDRSGKQRIFHVLIGEGCGTLMMDTRPAAPEEPASRLV